MKFFQKVNMASETVDSYNRTGVYYASYSGSTSLPAPCDSGDFVVAVNGLADHGVYQGTSASPIKDFNIFIATPPAALTAKGVFVVDIVKIPDAVINGQYYRVGIPTMSFHANAGEKVAMRLLKEYDQFILGRDNFATAPTLGQFAVLTAGSPVLTSASALGAGFTVRVDQLYSGSQGIDPAGLAYYCTVVQL